MNIVVIGGGAVGKSICKKLVDSNSHNVTIVDFEKESDQKNPIPGVTWVTGDACEPSVLEAANIRNANVLVAATGDDQSNLIVSFIAKTEFGIEKTVARVNHPKNQFLFNKTWGVDVWVSTPDIMTTLIEDAVSIEQITPIFRFAKSGASILKYTLDDNSIYAGTPLNKFDIPRGVTLCAINRGKTTIGPNEDIILDGGDEIIMLAGQEYNN